MIGGRAQKGQWLIGARYNSSELTRRIREIAKKAPRITLSNEDAASLVTSGSTTWPEKTLIYLDPPYYVKGRDLYYHHYSADDHGEVREAVRSISRQRWLVSYDDVPEVSELYASERWLRYGLGYSALSHAEGAEIMFFGPRLTMPAVRGSMREVSRGERPATLPDVPSTSEVSEAPV